MGVVAVLQARLLRRGVAETTPRAPLWPWRGSSAAARSLGGMELAWPGSHPQPQRVSSHPLHVDKASETVRHLRKAAQ